MTSPAGRQRNPSFNVAGLSRQCVVIVDVYRLVRMFNEDYGHNSACSSRSSACRRNLSPPAFVAKSTLFHPIHVRCASKPPVPQGNLSSPLRGEFTFSETCRPLSRRPALMRPLNDSLNSLHSLVRCLSGAVKPRMLCRSLMSIRGTFAALSTQADDQL